MRGVIAWIPMLVLAWMHSVLPVAPEPVRVVEANWCRMPEGLGGGAAILVRFEVAREWHMYWMNPGDSGAPPRARATLPEGWRLGSPVWPRPRLQQTDGESIFIHEGTWGWLVPVQGKDAAASPDFPVTLAVEWMACRQTCMVGKATVRVPPPSGTLPACPTEVGGSPFPSPPDAGDEVSVRDGRLRMRLRAHGCMSARFVQATDPGVQLDAGNPVDVPVQEGMATLDTPLLVRPQDADGHALAIRGLLLLGDRPRDPCVWIERKLPAAPDGDPTTP